MADSYLFRTIGINYLKLTPEDVEGYTMFFKLGMPVQLSSYPNSMSYFGYEYYDLPPRDHQTYRWKAVKDYVRMRYRRYNYLSQLRAVLPAKLHASIIDEFDQDHAMIITEGTNAGLF
jgi:hypothetical protein